jgi:hypothetical protein
MEWQIDLWSRVADGRGQLWSVAGPATSVKDGKFRGQFNNVFFAQKFINHCNYAVSIRNCTVASDDRMNVGKC